MQDQLTIRQIVEDTGLSYNGFSEELDMEELSARWAPQMLTYPKRHLQSPANTI